MSTQQNNLDLHETIADCIAFPFVHVVGGLKYFVSNKVSKASSSALISSTENQSAQNQVASMSPCFLSADRVHSQKVAGAIIYFHQFYGRYIRISTRSKGMKKEKFFTPEIAEKIQVHYNMDGAMKWLRQCGFDEPKKINEVSKETST
jgi:hypothetical protein